MHLPNNIIQKGTPISCGNHIGIALSEPVTIYSLRHLCSTEHPVRIYLWAFSLWRDNNLDIIQRGFPKSWWDDTAFTAIIGNKKSLLLTKESSVI